MDYAIIEASGKQIFIEPGKFYDLNYIEGDPGDIIHLNRVLFISKNKIIKVGAPCLTSNYIRARILKHVQGRKITIFKIKPKKNMRCKKGHRQKLTRLLIDDII